MFFIVTASVNQTVLAQGINPVNSWLYTNQATLFGDHGTPHDPATLIMPSTANAAGFGSYLDNPATVALFGTSFAEFGFGTRSVTEEVSFRVATRDHQSSDFENNITNAGFVHVFPVDIGRLVVGGGYTQVAGFNRSVSVSAVNFRSTITDFFKTPGGIYSGIAFNTFATDYGDEFQDWDESVFRIGFDNFGEFPGISQVFSINERGYSGEYSLFAATEFRRNLMVGISLGWVRGNYYYSREFTEIDIENNYSGNFIDTTGDGEPDTDIDRVILDDNLAITFSGFRARAGILYRISPFIYAGLSYTPSFTFSAEETLGANLTTIMNNRFRFDEQEDFDFSYRFKTSSKTSFGLALDRYYGLSLSLSLDYVDFKATRLDYEDSDLMDAELQDNEQIQEAFRNVWNVRSGVSFDVNPFLSLRGGYASYPSRFETNEGSREVFSFGAGFRVTSKILFDMAFQLEKWEEISSVYDFAQYEYSSLPDSPPDFTIQSESADRLVNRWSMLGSFVFLFSGWFQ